MGGHRDDRAAAGEPRRCPCGTGEPYAGCCRPLHRGEAGAASAEQLMRSRFSAFAVGDAGYLLRTWHPDTRPARLRLDPRQRWVRLEVLATTGGGIFETAGTVEFRAHCRDGARTDTLRERSRFVRVDGEWRYLDGRP